MATCRKCGATLQDPPTGRPPAYCSAACRRLAEFEIRRLTRKLDALEEERLTLEQPGIAKAALHDTFMRSYEQQLADVHHTIETVENRLRSLLGGEQKEGTPDEE